MARDASLLEQAAEHQVGPVVRFYQWVRPTISLGFHQRESVLDEDALTRERIPWVRRPTGGAAVLHSEELTYCLVLPADHPFQKGELALKHTGNALAKGLRALGVPAEVVERGYPLERLPDRTSCFVRSSRWEVCVRGKKIVGSAQRVLSGALLQHGSILCGPDHLRLVFLLRLSSEQVRDELHARLRAASTSIREELSAPFDMMLLREHLAQAFRQEFSVASHEPMRRVARIPDAKEIA
jgi:lipoate-protein ligase A